MRKNTVTSLLCPFSLIPMCFGAGLHVLKCSSAFLMFALCVHCTVVTALPISTTVYLELGKRVLLGMNSALCCLAS